MSRILAADYDAWYDTPRGRWIGDTEYRLVSGLLGARSTVLDAGCGTGWFTRRVAADGAPCSPARPSACSRSTFPLGAFLAIGGEVAR